MKTSFEKLALGVLTASAALMAATLVRREFFSTPIVNASETNAPPAYIGGWEEILSNAVTVGPTSAPMKIVEFTDFECPFCKVFNTTLKAVRRKFGDSVAVSIVHFPLSFHRFARPAARAVECAAEQGRFFDLADALFDKQDSLGLKSWVSFASDVGVSDSMAFGRCTADTAIVPRIENGIAVGERFKVKGTPTVIVNGWMYSVPPSEAELTRIASAILSGIDPHRGK